ncbi:MAG: tRNA lysidine(34) synthetase TilS [Magnetococcales bacterium]|nr:tRNA lysidine(34) synthetase TilS [Magnetococcales bacterium]
MPIRDKRALSTFLRQFSKESRSLFEPDSRVVVAVSGGADSIALMHLIARSNLLTPPISESVLVAHFDHNLRRESAEEGRFVQQAAKDLGLKTVLSRWQQPPDRGNLPAQAREARYHFLTRTASEHGANLVATGHHQDDQVETFLERLLRGSGITGLCAMAPSRRLSETVTLVRPLLYLSRAAIRLWLKSQQINWREDPSNDNTNYRRANLRHGLIPQLTRLEPQAIERVAATTQRMAQATSALEWALDQQWPKLACHEVAGGVSLDLLALKGLPDELLVRALRRCHQTVTKGNHPPGQKAVAGFIRLARSAQRGGEMRIRGIKITKENKRLVFCEATEAPH